MSDDACNRRPAARSGGKDTALILLSGGLDSAVSLAISEEEYIPSLALFFDYHQKARAKEEKAAFAIARHYGVRIRKVSLPWLGEITSSAIVDESLGIPEYPGQGTCGGEDASRAVWVENRNGIFINAAAAFAASEACSVIVAGFNLDEASAFPDNTREYLDAANRALALSVGSEVKVVAPTILMGKREIVSRGIGLDIPWEMIWSCYGAGGSMCGLCESCVRFRKALSGTSAQDRVRFSKGGKVEKEDI